MAKRPNISEVKTTRELFSLMPPENAGLLIAEMHTQAKQDVMREIDATHQTVKLPVDRIVPFDDNPYQVLDNEEMDELVQSIKERGILSPLTVLRSRMMRTSLNSSADTGGCSRRKRQG